MLKKIEDALTNAFTYIAMLVQVIMAIVVTYNVVTRYFFNFTPAWGEESALLCMVWFGFLSIALGVRDNLHLSLDIIDRFMPEKYIPPQELFKYLVIMSIGGFMLYQGSIMTQVGSWNNLPGMGISSAFIYAVVPLSGGSIILYSLSAILNILKNLGAKR